MECVDHGVFKWSWRLFNFYEILNQRGVLSWFKMLVIIKVVVMWVVLFLGVIFNLVE